MKTHCEKNMSESQNNIQNKSDCILDSKKCDSLVPKRKRRHKQETEINQQLSDQTSIPKKRGRKRKQPKEEVQLNI